MVCICFEESKGIIMVWKKSVFYAIKNTVIY